LEALKQLWEAVEKAQKAWAIVALIVAEALQAIGIGSSSMRHIMATAIIAGAVLGFFLPYRGSEEEAPSHADAPHAVTFGSSGLRVSS
jgi:hypothetical protein